MSGRPFQVSSALGQGIPLTLQVLASQVRWFYIGHHADTSDWMKRTLVVVLSNLHKS